MKDLIEALNIFLKYKDEPWPTHCSHDELAIIGIGRAEVTIEDQLRLNELGFHWTENGDGYWHSYRFA